MAITKTFDGVPIQFMDEVSAGAMTREVARLQKLVEDAAKAYDRGGRVDLEAGMAKWFATETAFEVATESMRIHGAYGYSKEFDIERLYRDAPLTWFAAARRWSQASSDATPQSKCAIAWLAVSGSGTLSMRAQTVFQGVLACIVRRSRSFGCAGRSRRFRNSL